MVINFDNLSKTITRSSEGPQKMLKSILVVDDDRNLSTTLAIILKRAGYQVFVANDSIQAMEEITDNVVDLVILDLHMPEMDGLTLLSKIHSDNPRLPVLVLTANPSLEKATEAANLGSCGLLLKPIDPHLLLTSVEEILENAFS